MEIVNIIRQFSCVSLVASTIASSTFVPLNALAASNSGDFFVSKQNAWRFTEDSQYAYAKGSASQLLNTKEAILHHSLGIKINTNLIDSFNFKVGCMIESATPLFELKVNSLDIRLFDTVNEFVYARFLVDQNQEFSLRGELVGRNRIIFAPVTKSQERSISDLFLQLREGGELKIGLLQGASGKPRVYNIPLAGFVEYSDKLIQSCQNYHQYFKGEQKFLPDYMAKEPEGYAPKDYSLVEKDPNIIDPNAPKEEPPVVVEKKEEVAKPIPVPEVLPFAPGGGPVSIGPDGLPIGVNSNGSTNKAGDAVPQSLGTASGPLQIGPDGKPIQASQNGQNSSNETTETSAEGAETSGESGGFLDIF